ncbi:chemotaxis protein CheW [Natroniella sulfidigena]|uniref:chemotaxis protein CheW n=1 Tax=Natroniella sulfidigena TaxID=723921 RepID=UPI00200B4200|nr:chemotaxis protein CheW [Natroniella sulfidigena]MCK8816258.1 chemotaxis protein CheW [Natroniella sulfidigena]
MNKIDQFIVFKLGTEEFGVKITQVQEIIKMKEITKLPQSADFIEGIINLRGDIITIIDLRKRLEFEYDPEAETRIIVVKINDIDVGFIVDDASEVVRIAQEEISQPSGGMAGIKTEFISGIAKLEDRLIILLALDKLLSTTEQAKLEEVADEN